MECFSGLHGVLPAVPDISHQQNLPVTEHPAAACPDDVQLRPVTWLTPCICQQRSMVRICC